LIESTVLHPSHSRCACFQDCKRKYYYRYILGARKRGAATRALAGKAGHAALDVLMRNGYDDIDNAHRALIALYDTHVPEYELAYITTEHLMAIVVNYCKHWPQDDDDWLPQPLHLHSLSPAVSHWQGTVDAAGVMMMQESPMIVQIGDTTATVVIDAVVRRADGKLWVVDHKFTAGYLGKNVLNKYLVSHQLPLYIAALKAALPEERVGGAILNAVYMGDKAVNPLSNALKFERYVFDYTDEQIDESVDWHRRTQAVAQAAESGLLAERDWVQNDNAYCAGCDYLALCEVGASMRPARLAAHFEITQRA
jgi:hypothetical protein